MVRCLIGLGSNLGDRAANLDRALALLQEPADITLVARSQWHETRPIGGPADQPAFLNGAAVVATALEPPTLLVRLLETETHLGRLRGQHWGPRTLDLDLLLAGHEVRQTPELTIPHPRLAFRRFVLVPAVEVAADWVHPTIGWTLARLLTHLDQAPPYVAITGLPGHAGTRLAREAAAAIGGRLLADPLAGNGLPDSLAAALELLDRRCRLLAAQGGKDAAVWAISDFWIGQALSEARSYLSAADYASFQTAWQSQTGGLPPPRLLITDKVKRPAEPPGPVLILPGASFERQLEEVIAAVRAMET